MNKSNPSGIKGLDIDPSGSFLAVGFVSGYTTVYHLQVGHGTLGFVRGYTTVYHLQVGHGTLGFVSGYTTVYHLQVGHGTLGSESEVSL